MLCLWDTCFFRLCNHVSGNFAHCLFFSGTARLCQGKICQIYSIWSDIVDALTQRCTHSLSYCSKFVSTNIRILINSILCNFNRYNGNIIVYTSGICLIGEKLHFDCYLCNLNCKFPLKILHIWCLEEFAKD